MLNPQNQTMTQGDAIAVIPLIEKSVLFRYSLSDYGV